MSAPTEILKKYWGYSQFRPMQEEIVQDVLDGKDTLALLPTGGGKSICFQVPGMCKTGTCLVISPLIALMKDQVEALQKKNISAIAITSTMSRRELDIVLENAVQGQYKFIYVSPERLYSQKFKERIPHLSVNLLAIDEAHCISQWGFDFRPAYRGIAEIRDLIPQAPVLALTATATPEVVTDIQEQLRFKKKNVLQKSFERKNLAYNVKEEEDKLSRIEKIANYYPGTGIVYVRSRKRTEEVSKYLSSKNIASSFYHAGLDPLTRSHRQEAWIKNEIRVMVCTNAFGMGIDKPDVRFVIHADVPENPEGYFQEAGRAGRDEKEAVAVLLYNESDKIDLERNFEASFPTIEEVRKVYQALAHFYQIPIGSGTGESFELNVEEFVSRFGIPAPLLFHSLKVIQREGYIDLTENYLHPSKIQFTASRDALYQFQMANERLGEFSKVLLRSYPGLFDYPVNINESSLAKRAGITYTQTVTNLEFLAKQNLLSYQKQNGNPQITFLVPRQDAANLVISPDSLKKRKDRARKRLDFMISYASGNSLCRSRTLLGYFGETETEDCGKCDVCRRNDELQMTSDESKNITVKVKHLVKKGNTSTESILREMQDVPEEKVLATIRELVDNDEIKLVD